MRAILATIDNLPISIKMGVMLLIPIVFLLILVGDELVRESALMEAASDEVIAVEFVEKLENVVHQLALERTISNKSTGARITHDHTVLKLQYEKSDRAVAQLNHFLQQREYHFDQVIRGRLSDFRVKWRQVESIRSQLLKEEHLQSTLETTFQYYSGQVEHLLLVIKREIDQIKSHQILNPLNAVYTLLWIKERAGQEQVRLNQFFTMGDLPDVSMAEAHYYIHEQTVKLREFFANPYIASHRLYQAQRSDPENQRLNEFRQIFLSRLKKGEILDRLRSLIGFGGMIHVFKNFVIRGREKDRLRFFEIYDEIIVVLNEFRALQGVTQSELDQLDIVEQNVNSYKDNIKFTIPYKGRQGVVAEIDALVKVDDGPALVALDHLTRQTGVDPDHWLERSTRRVNKLKTLSDQIRNDLMRSVKQQREVVQQRYFQYRNLLLLILFITLVTTFLLGRQLLRKFTLVASTIHKVEEEGDLSIRIETAGNDEIGQITRALNSLFDSQQRAIQGVIQVTHALAQGEFETRVEGDFHGDLFELKEGVNRSADQVSDYTRTMMQQRSELDNIVSSMGEGLVVVDRANRIQRLNLKLLRLIGREESALKGELVEVLFQQKENRLEVEGQGNVPSALITLMQGRLQKIHDENHDEFHLLLEGAPIPLLVIDLTEIRGGETVFLVSSEFEHQLGYPHGAMVGRPLSTLIAERDHKQLQNGLHGEDGRMLSDPEYKYHWISGDGSLVDGVITLTRIYCGKRTHALIMVETAETMEWNLVKRTPFGQLFGQQGGEEQHQELISADGSTIPVSVTGSVLYEGGAIQGAVLLLRDIRLLLNAESIRQANQAKDEFLASMSHELRTPLTSIIGNSEFLAEQEQDEEKLKLVRSIETAGRSQLALVNDILDMSKIESGKFTIEDHPYDLSILLNEIEQIFAVRVRDAGLTLVVDQQFKPEFQLVGDGQRIGQVLINLLGNAIKFTNHGNVTLSAWEQAGQIHFSVEDTGIGMSAEVVERLFQRFEQADGSISRRFGGSGLGLFISHHLAELMGGTIEVDSEEGRGSRFQLSLPLKLSTTPIKRAVEQRSEPRGVLSERIHGTVLIAEDTPELQMLEKKILQSIGVEVEVVADGRQAVEHALSRSYDLILMDMQMPVMDGIEATTRLRAEGCTTPVVALTANVMQKHRDAFEQAGVDDFLGKPIDRQALRRILQQFLRYGASTQSQYPLKRDRSKPSVSKPVELTRTQANRPLPKGDSPQESSNRGGNPLENTGSSSSSEPLEEVDEALQELFAERAQHLHNELQQAATSKDWKSLYTIAHTIKGSGTSFGFPQMTHAATELCDALHDEKTGQVPQLVEQLSREMRRAF